MSEDEEQGELFAPLTLIERRLVASPAAAGFAPTDELLFQHTVLCQASLPYRNPGDGCREWERRNGHALLEISAGKALHPEQERFVPIGLPYGPKPRLILSHLNAEALRTGKPEIEVEASLTAFIKRVGLDANGHTIRTVKDQLTRLAAATVRLGVLSADAHMKRARQSDIKLVEEFELWWPKDERQRVLWPGFVRLSPTYFESLQRHAVPLHPDALAALSHSAMGLDIYAWLAQRLHRIPQGEPQLVPWKALKDQFGWHYGAMYKFRQVFNDTMRQVLSQYPGARNAIEADARGLTLRHAPPPVLSRKSPVVRGGRRLVDDKTTPPTDTPPALIEDRTGPDA